jgi:hypothetical protein
MSRSSREGIVAELPPPLNSYQKSPLAVRLFKLPGVASVFLGSDFVTVGKSAEENWVALKPQIFELMMDAFALEGFKAYDDKVDGPAQQSSHVCATMSHHTSGANHDNFLSTRNVQPSPPPPPCHHRCHLL